MAGNFYDGTDAEFYSGSAHFSTQIGLEPVQYGLTAAQATAYAGLNTAYADLYNEAVNPVTRTRGVVAAKNAAKKAARADAIRLAAIIKATSTVTDQMLIDLGLNVRKQPTPIPPPTEIPNVDVERVDGNVVTLRVHGEGSLRAKPPHVVAAGVFTHVGAEPPADPLQWQYRGVATRTKFVVDFPESATALTVWITAAWQNAKGEAGPGCDPMQVNLPATPVMPDANKLKLAA